MRFGFGTVSVADREPEAALHLEGGVALLREVAEGEPALSGTVFDMLGRWDEAVAAARRVAERLSGAEEHLHDPSSLRINAPHEPRQVFCTGANYHRHVVEIICDRFAKKKMEEEGLTEPQVRDWAEAMMTARAKTGQPYIFARTFGSYAGPYDDLTLPTYAAEPDWEAELGVVFKTGGTAIRRENVMAHVAGYLVVNDITNRDQIFTADPPDMGADWLHAKNNPGYFPMGPWIYPAEFVPDPYNLRITLKLNGEYMQDENSDDMIFDIARQVETLTKYTRIYAGDVLATGSPSGNGTHYGRFLRAGDVMEASVGNLGVQRTRCVAREEGVRP